VAWLFADSGEQRFLSPPRKILDLRL
jgi:hypothetical protein